MDESDLVHAAKAAVPMTGNIICVCSFRFYKVSDSIICVGYLINWLSKPSVKVVHIVDLCHQLCVAAVKQCTL